MNRNVRIFVTDHCGMVGSANLIQGVHLAGVQRPVFPGLDCTHPRDCPQPDGTSRKLLHVTRISALGWHAQPELCEGIEPAYAAAPFPC